MKIWMNLTSSAQWNVSPVGITRVEKEISSQLKTRLNFFVHVGPNFKEIRLDQPFPTAQETREKNRSVRELRSIRILELYRNNSFQSKLKHIIGYSLSLVYKKFDMMDWFLVRFLSFALLCKDLNFRRFINRKSRRLNHKYEPHHQLELHNADIFQEGDVVLSLGLDWDYNTIDYIALLKLKKKIKFVSVIHDIIPIKHPSFVHSQKHSIKLLSHFNKVLRIADHVVCPSNTVAVEVEDLAKELALPKPQISVIKWAPFILDDHDIRRAECSFKPENAFMMAVGTVEPRKNFELFTYVFGLARELGIDLPPLIIVGKQGWGNSTFVRKIREDFYFEEKIKIVELADDLDLIDLYTSCSLFLSPSFDEGFGLPVAEAIHCGAKTLISDIPVYRELFPNSLHASPNDPARWLDIIVKHLESIKQSSSSVSRYQKVETRTWRDVSEELFQILESFSIKLR